MLTLAPGSSCDVCAEEYGPHCQPHAIPCGHVLCASCCKTIAEKTPPRLSPVCPFCRVQFTPNDLRLIRTDFPSSSGWSTPRRMPVVEANIMEPLSPDLWTRRTERMLSSDESCSRAREEARRLEDRVAKVAQKKSSVEEVSTLHKELEDWLTSAVKTGDQTSSLYLSAALLRAILVNHVAHSDASRAAKSVEASLKGKLDDVELTNEKLEAELRRQREQNNQKAQECQALRTELQRLRVVATTLGAPQSALQEPRQTSPPISPSATPVPSSIPASYSSQPASSPLSRFNSTHARSSSTSRPATPSHVSHASVHAARSYTPAPPPVPRSHTPVTPPARSQTSMGMRFPSSSPSSHSHRTQTPAPPPIPPKPRRLSIPSPPQMAFRSLSEEKHDVHERWIPPLGASPPSDYQFNKSGPPGSVTKSASSKRFTLPGLQRTVSSSASHAARLREVRSPSPQ